MSLSSASGQHAMGYLRFSRHMRHSVQAILAGLILTGCDGGAPSSNGLAPGTFVATLEGAAIGELKGKAFWMHRRWQYEATPNKQSLSSFPQTRPKNSETSMKPACRIR